MMLEELIKEYEILPSNYFNFDKNGNLTDIEETIKYNKNKEK